MRKIWNTILKGLVAILPIGLTLYVIAWLAGFAEQVFAPVIKVLVPVDAYKPGFGLLAGIVLLYLLGLAVNAYVVSRALRLSDTLFAHPGDQDHLPRHPRLHALLPQLGQGQ